MRKEKEIMKIKSKQVRIPRIAFLFFYFLCVFSAYSLAAATGRGEAAVRSAKQKLDFPKYLEIIITKILNVKTILFHRVRPPDDPVEVLSKDDEIINQNIIENYEENYEKRTTGREAGQEEEFKHRKIKKRKS